MEPIPSEDDDHNNRNEDNKLKLYQGVALLTADCLGVGVLALPYDLHMLGWAFGISFLLANLPINYIAGNYLSVIALDIETTATTTDSGDNKEVELTTTATTTTQATKPMEETEEMVHRRKSAKEYAGIPNVDDETVDESMMVHEHIFDDEDIGTETPQEEEKQPQDQAPLKATYDLISISDQVFQSKNITRLVILLYYTNLFLVLGDYMLVMSRAVSAMFLDQICIPAAGAIASILMFAICQLKTMANIGRKVSVVSLIAMLVVLLQCLFHHRTGSAAVSEEEREEDENQSIWQKLSALASIAFAVGSQKLFLNIRHELKHREQASRALAWSLTTYGTAYLIVIVLAGPSKFL
jgi:amino acid permease